MPAREDSIWRSIGQHNVLQMKLKSHQNNGEKKQRVSVIARPKILVLTPEYHPSSKITPKLQYTTLIAQKVIASNSRTQPRGLLKSFQVIPSPGSDTDLVLPWRCPLAYIESLRLLI